MKLLKQILIVEDDHLLAADMKYNLIKEGRTVTGIARNLTKGVRIMVKLPADLP